MRSRFARAILAVLSAPAFGKAVWFGPRLDVAGAVEGDA